jgi:hypothetical protein
MVPGMYLSIGVGAVLPGAPVLRACCCGPIGLSGSVCVKQHQPTNMRLRRRDIFKGCPSEKLPVNSAGQPEIESAMDGTLALLR